LGEGRRIHEHIEFEEILFSRGDKKSKIHFSGAFSIGFGGSLPEFG